jgi:capsular polysaccharide biosynthesis protein
MDVSGALHTLRKHWILTSVLVLLTLVAAYQAWVKIPGPYQSSSQVVFLASQQTSKPNGNNPYLSFDDTLSTTADIVRREVLDPRIVAALAARGFKDTYDIQNDPLGVGPILDITATGPTKAGVMATQAAVTAEVQNQLQQLQTDLLAKDQVNSMVVTSSPQATLLVSKKARPVVAVLVVGFILTLAIPQMVDAVQNRGRNRRKKSGQRPWAPIETPASTFSYSDGAKSGSYSDAPRSSQLTPTVGQRTETNGKVEPEAGNRSGATSSGVDF